MLSNWLNISHRSVWAQSATYLKFPFFSATICATMWGYIYRFLMTHILLVFFDHLDHLETPKWPFWPIFGHFVQHICCWYFCNVGLGWLQCSASFSLVIIIMHVVLLLGLTLVSWEMSVCVWLHACTCTVCLAYADGQTMTDGWTDFCRCIDVLYYVTDV